MKKILNILNEIKEAGKLNSAASQILIDNFEKEYFKLPEGLKNIYEHANGFETDSFKLFPLFSKDDKKKTWESIERINSLENTKYEIEQDLLSNYVIFCDIGGGNFAMYSKKDNTIWYAENNEYHQTSFNFDDFFEALLKDTDS